MPIGIKGFKAGHIHSEETKRKIGDANRNQVYFNCIECYIMASSSPSSYARKKNHFCSRTCYANFVKKLPFYEKNNYRGVRTAGESKQAYHRNYVKNHPDVISHLKARHYARKRDAEGSHTLSEWNDLKLKFNHKCAICKEDKKLTKDHIIPVSKGGSDYIINIQPLCRNCNSKKHNRIYEHSALLGETK